MFVFGFPSLNLKFLKHSAAISGGCSAHHLVACLVLRAADGGRHNDAAHQPQWPVARLCADHHRCRPLPVVQRMRSLYGPQAGHSVHLCNFLTFFKKFSFFFVSSLSAATAHRSTGADGVRRMADSQIDGLRTDLEVLCINDA